MKEILETDPLLQELHVLVWWLELFQTGIFPFLLSFVSHLGREVISEERGSKGLCSASKNSRVIKLLGTSSALGLVQLTLQWKVCCSFTNLLCQLL